MPGWRTKVRGDVNTARAVRSREGGFALVIVLGVLSLLALVAIVLQKTVVADISATSHLKDRARAEALADGLTRLAVRHLSINRPADGRSGPLRLDGVPTICRSGTALAAIAFLNVDGMINLNRASQALLERVLRGVGLAPADATRMAQDIIDFRTQGDLSLSGGSKLSAYQLAGLSHGPKNGLFQSVGELGQVIGMTPQLLERLRQLFTVHSRFAVVNPNFVSMPVAMALLGGEAAPQDLDVLHSRLNLPSELTYIPRTRGTGTTSSNTYLVRVVIREGAAGFTREAVAELKATLSSDATFMDWSERDSSLYDIDPTAGDDAPACISGVLWLDPA